MTGAASPFAGVRLRVGPNDAKDSRQKALWTSDKVSRVTYQVVDTFAAELVRRWNAHEAMVEALRLIARRGLDGTLSVSVAAMAARSALEGWGQ